MSVIEATAPFPTPVPHPRTEPVLIREITLRNLLSFGPDSQPVPLQALNVIIGANGSGKSNFIDGISLLQAAPTGLSAPISSGGSITEWIYKGTNGVASIEALVHYPKATQPLRHLIAFKEEAQRFRLIDERIEEFENYPSRSNELFYYRFQNGQPAASVNGRERQLKLEDAEMDASILAQRRDPELYPEITYLGQQYNNIKIYKDWTFGRRSGPSRSQPADLPNANLAEDFSNLALVLNRFKLQPPVRSRLLEAMADFMDGVTGYEVFTQGGTVQLFLEDGKFMIPATRLSDGTMRYLCLLAILLQPSPPPLVCIDEPELGLHPDVLPGLVDLMVEASSRMQLVVTTQSEMIVDALSEYPDAVLTCGKEDGSTVIRRLEQERLKPWLEKYRLGELWMSGEIGAKRW
ncbi:MAG: AAA family ATPase [Armatimonadota bacterium]|nr:AAA family ATPase [Armatimonadota bacterium]